MCGEFRYASSAFYISNQHLIVNDSLSIHQLLYVIFTDIFELIFILIMGTNSTARYLFYGSMVLPTSSNGNGTFGKLRADTSRQN